MSVGSGTEPERQRARVVLPGVGLEVSRLGFGTSAVMSRVNRRESVRLLEAALDCGLTHFDTARSYGFGEAELAVGDVLVGRRDQVTVTTKAGILPPRRSAGLGAAKALARGVLAVMPGMRAVIRRRAGTLVQAGRFDECTMRESLEASLRSLRTEYVDVLLLHEPSCEVLDSEEPLSFLERVRAEGKVRAFGIAATPQVVAHALNRVPEYAPVVQIPNSVFAPTLQVLNLDQGRTVVTHSALGAAIAELRTDLAGHAELRDRWSRELQVDIKQTGVLEGLALQYALAALPKGVVLFTSTKAEHIRENAAALNTAASGDQLDRLVQLVSEWMQSKRQG